MFPLPSPPSNATLLDAARFVTVPGSVFCHGDPRLVSDMPGLHREVELLNNRLRRLISLELSQQLLTRFVRARATGVAIFLGMALVLLRGLVGVVLVQELEPGQRRRCWSR